MSTHITNRVQKKLKVNQTLPEDPHVGTLETPIKSSPCVDLNTDKPSRNNLNLLSTLLENIKSVNEPSAPTTSDHWLKRILSVFQDVVVKEIDVSSSRKAVIVQIPYRQLETSRASCLLQTLIKELERRLSGTDILFVAHYKILPKPKSRIRSQRARSRTLTHVHQMILRDLVFPTEIVGKRIRYLSDGSKIFKVYLEPKDRYCTENKLETYNAAFEKITGKKAVFLYPVE